MPAFFAPGVSSPIRYLSTFSANSCTARSWARGLRSFFIAHSAIPQSYLRLLAIHRLENNKSLLIVSTSCGLVLHSRELCLCLHLCRRLPYTPILRSLHFLLQPCLRPSAHLNAPMLASASTCSRRFVTKIKLLSRS